MYIFYVIDNDNAVYLVGTIHKDDVDHLPYRVLRVEVVKEVDNMLVICTEDFENGTSGNGK